MNNKIRKKFKKVKKIGSSSYYVSYDKTLFMKRFKGSKKFVKKEYLNLKKNWNNLDIKNLQCIEPIAFSEEKGILITKYIDAEPLINLLIPKIYFKFGQKLKLFHKNGYSHGHFEFTDVLYNKRKFILTDLVFLNIVEPIFDLASLKMSIMVYKLKRPWLWRKYDICYKAFITGYGFNNIPEVNKTYKKIVNQSIKFALERKNLISKFKGYIMILLRFFRLL